MTVKLQKLLPPKELIHVRTTKDVYFGYVYSIDEHNLIWKKLLGGDTKHILFIKDNKLYEHIQDDDKPVEVTPCYFSMINPNIKDKAVIVKIHEYESQTGVVMSFSYNLDDLVLDCKCPFSGKIFRVKYWDDKNFVKQIPFKDVYDNFIADRQQQINLKEKYKEEAKRSITKYEEDISFLQKQISDATRYINEPNKYNHDIQS